MKKFIPFNKIADQSVIVVDGLHPNHLTLSHWKGANVHPDIRADTSGEIVLNALEKNYKGIHLDLISATHFDIDGFVGVFALFYPELAMRYKQALSAMARIGDFRELRPNDEVDEFALKLCCWMNTVEKKEFYRPFEEKDEIELCVPKFNYFLSLFPNVLVDIDRYRADWEKEYKQVKEGLQLIESVEQHSGIGLITKKVESPIHYYALFAATENFDIVLSIYIGNKYELEYKYTTWVDIASRKVYPRIALNKLCDQLNKKEQSDYTWAVDRISDTGPILRLENSQLSKVDRYANPFEREIYSSSIAPKIFEQCIIDFFRTNYEAIEPKRFWTWQEMKALKPN